MAKVADDFFYFFGDLTFRQKDGIVVAPDDVADDNNYNSDLFCEEVGEEDCDLCSGCDEKPIAHLVQPCGHMICTN